MQHVCLTSTCLPINLKSGARKPVLLRFHTFGEFHLSHVMRKPVLAICEQQRCRSACASAQSDQHLCFRYLDSIIPILDKSKTLTGLCSWAGRSESYLVADPDDRFSHDEAQLLQFVLERCCSCSVSSVALVKFIRLERVLQSSQAEEWNKSGATHIYKKLGIQPLYFWRIYALTDSLYYDA